MKQNNLNHHKILAIIPARKGSKGLPLKNVLKLQGKPLLNYSINAALNSKYITQTIVSTDDQDIKHQAEQAGATVPFLRPPELATDTASTLDVVKHAVQFYQNNNQHFDLLIVLQPTSPLRNHQHIDQAIEMFLQHPNKEHISLVSGYKLAAKYNWCLFDTDGYVEMKQQENSLPRQSLGNVYMPNGAIFLISSKNINNGFYHKNTIIFEMPEELSVDIDSKEDFERANQLLLKNSTNHK